MQFAIERALSAAELDWRFLSLDVATERLPAAIAGIDALGFVGASIAAPHGSLAAKLVPHLTAEAAAARWVDCLSRDAQDVLTGHNLLGHWLAEVVQAESLVSDDMPEPTAVLVGNSESAVAACAPLVCRPLNRWLLTHLDASAFDLPHGADSSEAASDTGDAAEPSSEAAAESTSPTASANPLREASGRAIRRARSVDAAVSERTRLIVRTSLPDGQPAEFPEALLDRMRPPAVVVDLAVASSTSPLARAAEQRGLRGFNRLDLLIARAAAALQLWTGQRTDTDVLREAFEEYLEI